MTVRLSSYFADILDCFIGRYMLCVYIPCSFICVLDRLLAFLVVLFGR